MTHEKTEQVVLVESASGSVVGSDWLPRRAARLVCCRLVSGPFQPDLLVGVHAGDWNHRLVSRPCWEYLPGDTGRPEIARPYQGVPARAH